MGPVILVAQLSHHTSTLTSCNGMSRINMGNLLYWEFIYIYVCVCVCVCIYIYIYICVCVCVCVYIYILNWNHVKPTIQNECYCVSHTMKLPVHKIQFSLWSVLHSLWTSVDAVCSSSACSIPSRTEHLSPKFLCICNLSKFAWHCLLQLCSVYLWFKIHVATIR